VRKSKESPQTVEFSSTPQSGAPVQKTCPEKAPTHTHIWKPKSDTVLRCKLGTRMQPNISLQSTHKRPNLRKFGWETFDRLFCLCLLCREHTGKPNLPPKHREGSQRWNPSQQADGFDLSVVRKRINFTCAAGWMLDIVEVLQTRQAL
jgi:hypothetical protein